MPFHDPTIRVYYGDGTVVYTDGQQEEDIPMEEETNVNEPQRYVFI